MLSTSIRGATSSYNDEECEALVKLANHLSSHAQRLIGTRLLCNCPWLLPHRSILEKVSCSDIVIYFQFANGDECDPCLELLRNSCFWDSLKALDAEL